ncbi:hypothetical protein [Cardiobacterium sp. Marseille-Q4385]|jgi:hypothetical protein|uniref:hypothetical protein n=1 Tax=Cardiobacterium sp. Marseille-Q4385 TaxID=2866573 RepID=UPI001CE3F84B|nr:hypothetical protein [Cardiobacterium sp. Marseille-Q4385]
MARLQKRRTFLMAQQQSTITHSSAMGGGNALLFFRYLRCLSILLSLLAATSALTVHAADAGNESLYQRISIPAECRNLHKVTDIDDLIRQLYDNIDSYCLFDIAPDALEKIWGLPVFDFINKEWKEMDRLNLQVQKLYAENDSLFIKRRIDNINKVAVLNIAMTESYNIRNDGYGGNISEGKFPDIPLAPGIVRPDTLPPPHSPPIARPDEPLVYIPENTVYKIFTTYYWLNHDGDKEKPVLILDTLYIPSPDIRFYKTARPLVDLLTK